MFDEVLKFSIEVRKSQFSSFAIESDMDHVVQERQTYDAICARAQAVFNRFLRAGTVLKVRLLI